MKKLILLVAIMLTISFVSFAQTKKEAKKVTTEVTLTPPPVDSTGLFGVGIQNAMNSMGPMMSNMAKSMMQAQLDYYKQPGKLEEIAKVQKQYFDALVKEGFTNDQALKIITSDSLLPKASGVK